MEAEEFWAKFYDKYGEHFVAYFHVLLEMHNIHYFDAAFDGSTFVCFDDYAIRVSAIRVRTCGECLRPDVIYYKADIIGEIALFEFTLNTYKDILIKRVAEENNFDTNTLRIIEEYEREILKIKEDLIKLQFALEKYR